MRKLWHDIQTHKGAAMLFLLYWLVTLGVIRVTWSEGIPGRVAVLLLATPLIAGALAGRWRVSTQERAARLRDRITAGMLAGMLSAVITLLVMKGGAIYEVIGWTHGLRIRWIEVLAFCIASGVLGALLGLAGAVLAGKVARR